jgi:1-acyl-sn-glycerol-3-phosphate acyltransferase
MLYAVGKFLVWLFFALFFRIRVSGRENIPPKGPFLMYANHVHALDMFLIASKMKPRVHYMAKAELFKNKILAFLLKHVGAFPVHRGKGDVGSIKTVYRLLEKGSVVGIFPEGTRTKKKDLTKKKGGAALMALTSGVPILPVAVEGSFKLFSRISVVYGKPFSLEIEAQQESGKYTKEELNEASVEILNRIYALIGQ